MNKVFFFDEPQQWRQYMEELGIQGAIDALRAKGLPCEWPLFVPDPENPATLKATVTASSYKSECPHYRGHWLCGGTGGVECAAAGEIIPGIVWYKTCSEKYVDCPFYKKECTNEHDISGDGDLPAGHYPER